MSEQPWRSCVAGRARTIGNRVTVISRSRVRIPPSPPEHKQPLYHCDARAVFFSVPSRAGPCGTVVRSPAGFRFPTAVYQKQQPEGSLRLHAVRLQFCSFLSIYHAVQTAICQNQPCAARSLSRRASAPLNGELKNAAQRHFLIPSVHSFPSPASSRRMPAASSCCRTRSSAASSGQIRVCRCTPSVREQSGAALAESSKKRLTS